MKGETLYLKGFVLTHLPVAVVHLVHPGSYAEYTGKKPLAMLGIQHI